MNTKSPDKSGARRKASKPSPASGASPARPSAPSPHAKQRKYVAGLVAGKSKKQAALEAGYAPSTAENAKQKIDRRPGVQELFQDLLEDAGVTDKLLAQRIREGLNATIVSKETAHALREVLIDFAERREMVELAIKMKGLMPADELHHKVTLEDLLDEAHRG
jgi:phage terminase small subunit